MNREKLSSTYVIEVLNTVLANEFVLYTKTLNFHWNIKGPDFGALHKFLEGQYEDLFDIIDRVAERVQAVHGVAFGTLKEMREHAMIEEDEDEVFSDELQLLELLLEGHQIIIEQLKQEIPELNDDYQDYSSANMLTEILEKHEKMAWMLRSFLESYTA